MNFTIFGQLTDATSVCASDTRVFLKEDIGTPLQFLTTTSSWMLSSRDFSDPTWYTSKLFVGTSLQYNCPLKKKKSRWPIITQLRQVRKFHAENQLDNHAVIKAIHKHLFVLVLVFIINLLKYTPHISSRSTHIHANEKSRSEQTV